MQTKSLIAMLLGIAALLGSAAPSKAVCLMDCGSENSSAPPERGSNGNGNKIDGNQAAGTGNQSNGNINNSVVVNGVRMRSENNVSVGANSGEVNTNSNVVIMGVDQSHGNSSNTTTQKR